MIQKVISHLFVFPPPWQNAFYAIERQLPAHGTSSRTSI